MKHVLVIQESDRNVVGVASTVEKSFDLIKKYFGENSEIINVRYIEDSGLEYDCEVFVNDDDGYTYGITVYYFTTDDL